MAEKPHVWKWRRIAAGKYTAPTPCGQTVVAEKFYHEWKLYFVGGYAINCKGWSTLAAAKLSAPNLLDLLRIGWEKRQADEATKQRDAKTQSVLAVVYNCRLADSKTPPAGIPWHAWAERKVGCTGADIRKLNRWPVTDEGEDDEA